VLWTSLKLAHYRWLEEHDLTEMKFGGVLKCHFNQ
jgi:hypothetical protein